ncbi:MAG: hypothetical protein J6U15_02245 [Lachnospiraceae bacterium]|nr:hypothetical protein [Lachnospiraceae bacterium]
MKKYKELIYAVTIVVVVIVLFFAVFYVPKYIRYTRAREEAHSSIEKLMEQRDSIDDILFYDYHSSPFEEYQISDKEQIEKVMDVLGSVELKPIEISKEQKMDSMWNLSRERKTGFSLCFDMNPDFTAGYWLLTLDCDEELSDFTMLHTAEIDIDSTLYDFCCYTKSEPLYEKIKSIFKER